MTQMNNHLCHENVVFLNKMFNLIVKHSYKHITFFTLLSSWKIHFPFKTLNCWMQCPFPSATQCQCSGCFKFPHHTLCKLPTSTSGFTLVVMSNVLPLFVEMRCKVSRCFPETFFWCQNVHWNYSVEWSSNKLNIRNTHQVFWHMPVKTAQNIHSDFSVKQQKYSTLNDS